MLRGTCLPVWVLETEFRSSCPLCGCWRSDQVLTLTGQAGFSQSPLTGLSVPRHSSIEEKQAIEDAPPNLDQSQGLTQNCLSRTGAVPRRGTSAKRIPEDSLSKSTKTQSQLSGETAPRAIPGHRHKPSIKSELIAKALTAFKADTPCFSFFNLRLGERCVCGILREYFKISTHP